MPSETTVRPIMENEALSKDGKDKVPNKTSPIAALPISYAMPSRSPVTRSVERKRKEFEKEKMSNEVVEIEPKRIRRTLKLPINVKSPYIERFVKLGVKCSQEEDLLFEYIFRLSKGEW